MQESIKGVVVDIRFQKKEDGFTIATIETETDIITILGSIPFCEIGKKYKLTGTYKTHPKFGEQFAFDKCEEIMPEDVDSIELFLASGVIKGVGKKTARLIIQEFAENSLDVIESEFHRLCNVSGIGPQKAKKIHDSYISQIEFAKISIQLQAMGVGLRHIYKLYEAYGSNTISLIEQNPYKLIDDIGGFGFKKADEIAKNIGIEQTSPNRIKSAIMYGMQVYLYDGHVYVPKSELLEKIGELLDISCECIDDCLPELIIEGKIFIDDIEGMEVVYLLNYYVAEQNVAHSIVQISQAEFRPFFADIEGLISKTEAEKEIELTEEQKSAVISTVSNGFTVITGGPGTGKTTIIKAIINLFKEEDFKIAIAAPTGRAAKRIIESTGENASTIHRLLEYGFSDDDSLNFARNENNPLEQDVVIIDEASMIDLLLMESLLNAIQEGTRVVLVGDSDQLPSVGAGNVLRDIIDSEVVYTIVLKEIFRQAQESLIVVNSHRINHGEYPVYNDKENDFFIIDRKSEKDIIETIVSLVSGRLHTYFDITSTLSDIQILTPIRKGALGISNLNNVLQNVLNPLSEVKSEKKFGDRLFREGDKVMQIKNNYGIDWRKYKAVDSVFEWDSSFNSNIRVDSKYSNSIIESGKGVFNGDIGMIERIDNSTGKTTVLFDEEKYVTYDVEMLEELELAYAMTVHKSQGCEFPVVLFPLTYFPPLLATRNLLYTALTRAKHGVVLIGNPRIANRIVDNNTVSHRYSGLKSKIIEMNNTLSYNF